MKILIVCIFLFPLIVSAKGKEEKTEKVLYSKITDISVKQDKIMKELNKLSLKQEKYLEEKANLLKKITTISKKKRELIKEKRKLFEMHNKLMVEYILVIKGK